MIIAMHSFKVLWVLYNLVSMNKYINNKVILNHLICKVVTTQKSGTKLMKVIVAPSKYPNICHVLWNVDLQISSLNWCWILCSLSFVTHIFECSPAFMCVSMRESISLPVFLCMRGFHFEWICRMRAVIIAGNLQADCNGSRLSVHLTL